MISLLIASDQLLAAFTVGITVWHFFLQAPLLLKLLGKEKFVPLMMQLTRLWIKAIFTSATLTLVVASLLRFGQNLPLKMVWPLLGWSAVSINHFVVVPKALKAGAQSQKERKGDDSKDLKEFAVRGGGKSKTKALHQTVVVFVVLMLVGLLPHMVDLSAASMTMAQ